MCLLVYIYVCTCGRGGYECICVEFCGYVCMWLYMYVCGAMCMCECVSVCAVGSWAVELGASPMLLTDGPANEAVSATCLLVPPLLSPSSLLLPLWPFPPSLVPS